MFVSHTHGVWNNLEGRRKPSKRYGRLVRSPNSGLSEMLVYHKDTVFGWIDNRVNAKESEDESETVGQSKGNVDAQPLS